jgi:maltose O-acetyltransferase
VPTERQKRDAGAWYTCIDDDLEAARQVARRACFAHQATPPDARGPMAAELRAVLGDVGDGVVIEAPFHCAYGHNIRLADGVYLNAGCVILDTGPVTIGAGAMLGPGVQIYCADHHRDRDLRSQGMERALAVEIGADVWIGGAAIILPGVRIGPGAVIGAGSVVTRDVAENARVAGNPARVLPGQA